jgi:hypothetical protein
MAQAVARENFFFLSSFSNISRLPPYLFHYLKKRERLFPFVREITSFFVVGTVQFFRLSQNVPDLLHIAASASSWAAWAGTRLS